MKTYVIQIDGIVQPESYTSLKQACLDSGVSYPAAVKGKRKFIVNDAVVIISETEVVKIVGRENNFKSNQNERK